MRVRASPELDSESEIRLKTLISYGHRALPGRGARPGHRRPSSNGRPRRARGPPTRTGAAAEAEAEAAPGAAPGAAPIAARPQDPDEEKASKKRPGEPDIDIVIDSDGS